MSKFDPATVEALSRAVCEAWGRNPDHECFFGLEWQRPEVRKAALAYLAMRAVGATLPKQDLT